MIKRPGLPRKTPEEVAPEVRVFLIRLHRRRKRFRKADQKHLCTVRQRVAEAVSAGIGPEEVAKICGYAPKTIDKWLAKHRDPVQEVEIDAARERLSGLRAQRSKLKAEEMLISARARSVIRKAMRAQLDAPEFVELTGYQRATVERWFASTRRVLSQAHRRREIASVRRGKANRPPQELSPVEYDQWLVEQDMRRKTLFRKYELQPKRRRFRRRDRLQQPLRERWMPHGE
ncbi:hypothetical protein [Streptomyces sp. Isolate_45]|uniref:hypothetical protein n=1 Tax=Streptomyces sp. Isolate_45 TaxID=2950111 RepID=UPI002481AD31|nr:hypothetical protein [Streptomyces sp. Isolate_45]MDA5283669.1 hypothetical protein [Streptomyces sp. Isolate_45]